MTVVERHPRPGADEPGGSDVTGVRQSEPTVPARPEGSRHQRVTEVGPIEVHRRVDAKWKLPVVFLLVLAVLSFAVWATAGELLGGGPAVTLPRIELPDVTGQSSDSAQDALEKLGFVVNLKYSPNEVIERGTAFEQQPQAGAKLEQGGIVEVRVSDGPLGTTVPDVAGQAAADAATVLRSSGLGVATADEHSEQVPIGQVVRTQPESGGRIALDGTVTLVLSSGPAPRLVPELVGRTLEQALVDIGRAGLAVGELIYRPQEGAAEGTILEASQPVGASVPRDMPVDLVIAGTGGQSTVPYLVGLRQSSASAVLRSAGLTAEVVTAPIDPGAGQAGRVIAQGIPPQTKVTKGSAIQITVGVNASPAAPASAAPTTTAAPPGG